MKALSDSIYALLRHFAFEISIPDETPGQIPVVEFVADATDRQLVAAVRLTTGPINVALSYVLASNPDLIEIVGTPLDRNVRTPVIRVAF